MYLLFVSSLIKLIVYIDLFDSCTENAARAYGLPDAELFQTVDLFEKRNIPQVTQCIHALGRFVNDQLRKIINLILISF